MENAPRRKRGGAGSGWKNAPDQPSRRDGGQLGYRCGLMVLGVIAGEFAAGQGFGVPACSRF